VLSATIMESSIPVKKLLVVYLTIFRCCLVAQTAKSFYPITTTSLTRISSIRCHQTEVRTTISPFIQIPSFLYTSTHLGESNFSWDKNCDDDDDNISASSSINIDNDDDNDDDNMEQWDHEETLLVINLRPQIDLSQEECLSQISQYTQSFPFAALLPVQPLQYLPTSDGGVEVKFLRKKTQTKSSIDGGVRFFVRNLLQHDTNERKDVDDDNSNNIIEILVKRNSNGQSIAKIFAEKLLIQGFVRGITSESADDCENDNNNLVADKFPKTRIESPTKRMVNIEGIFHKWM